MGRENRKRFCSTISAKCVYVCLHVSSLGDEENEEDKIMSKEEAGVDPSDQEDSSDSEGEEDGVCLLEGQAPIATKKGKKKPRTKRRKTKEVPSSVAMRQEVRAGLLVCEPKSYSLSHR